MSLAEPTTTLTDYALAVVSTAFSVRLFLGVGGSGQTCHWLWALGSGISGDGRGGRYRGNLPRVPAVT